MSPAWVPPVVLERLPAQLRRCLVRMRLEDVEEIRLSAGRPLIVVGRGGDIFVTAEGEPTCRQDGALAVTWELVQDALQLMTRSSAYALEEEFRRGYLSLPGGHRVGMVGRAVLEGGRVRTLRDVAGLNIRLAREVRGAADALVAVVLEDRVPRSLLLLSPPRGGKTTVLRDLVRQVSDRGYRVGLVDERSELAGSVNGLPQLEVGIRTDVLDACPKAEGIYILLRAMGSQVIACDEIGDEDEAAALADAARAGVRVMATAHASGLDDAMARPALGITLRQGVFERVGVLSRRLGPATLEEVLSIGPHPGLRVRRGGKG
ncbi:MAG TPA: stage III sporulation protein AA [Bacillota bacterium]|nr:stage III sporulation protein AA [Bacillota bacterium]